MRQRRGIDWRLGPLLVVGMLAACTQETQNKFGRAIQNWTGTNGVLEIYAGDRLVRRFIEIDKLSTAISTQVPSLDSPVPLNCSGVVSPLLLFQA